MDWLIDFSPSMANLLKAVAELPGPCPALALVMFVVIGLFAISSFTNARSGKVA